jgi:CheY-like chemotaxis protein
VYEPFFTTKEVGRGSGLGLSQVYGFVRNAGGHIRIDSEVGAGTTVKFYLPRSAERPLMVDPSVSVTPLAPARWDETVLIVEDDPKVMVIAVENMQALGYRVLTAVDAGCALEVLRGEEAVDILFSDVVMPGGMNGAQLAIEARRLRPRLKVLLVSGYTALSLSQDHGLPRNLEFLSKPYRREELVGKLRVITGSG